MAILTSKDFTELNDIASKFLDSKIREKLVRDVLKFSMDEFILDVDERIALDKIVEMETKKNAKEEEKISIIKALLLKNMNYQDISDVSGKSIDEIKEIEKSIRD